LNILMGRKNMQKHKPEVLVFAGPNGSGKSTITEYIDIVGEYINADDIKRSIFCTDEEAAKRATKRKEELIEAKEDFTFETVFSSSINVNLLKNAKENGYFIKAFFVLTANAEINVLRVAARVADGGHDVPVDKIRKRYVGSLGNLKELVKVADVLHVYDNTEDSPYRIYKKKRAEELYWETAVWSKGKIEELIGHNLC